MPESTILLFCHGKIEIKKVNKKNEPYPRLVTTLAIGDEGHEVVLLKFLDKNVTSKGHRLALERGRQQSTVHPYFIVYDTIR